MEWLSKLRYNSVILAFTINVLLILVTLISYRKFTNKDIAHTASKLGLVVTIKAIILLIFLVLSLIFFDIRNEEFGISFGIFLFLGILYEIHYFIRLQNQSKKM